MSSTSTMPSLMAHFRGHRDAITSLAFHPTLQTVYSSSADGFVYSWSFKKDARALR
jgi:WD40 repeat protein